MTPIQAFVTLDAKSLSKKDPLKRCMSNGIKFCCLKVNTVKRVCVKTLEELTKYFFNFLQCVVGEEPRNVSPTELQR